MHTFLKRVYDKKLPKNTSGSYKVYTCVSDYGLHKVSVLTYYYSEDIGTGSPICPFCHEKIFDPKKDETYIVQRGEII